MGGDYRDDLAAAHARIAELEEKVGALEAELSRGKSTPPDPEIQELEAAVALRRLERKRTTGQRTFLLAFAVAFLAATLFFLSKNDVPAATVSGIVVLALVAGRSFLRPRLAVARRSLADAERRVAEARRVRVDATAADVVDDDRAEDQNVVRFRA